MSEIIAFPSAEQLSEVHSEDAGDKLHAEAFRDLEGAVCDVDRMGEIANDLIMRCAATEDSLHDLELATFAVWQLAKMLKELRASYYKRWHGDLVGVS
ncbi:hypothetical protein Q2941_12040 [Bradyrhizobium sp. UFLA05-153]